MGCGRSGPRFAGGGGVGPLRDGPSLSGPYTLGGYREAPPPAELRDLADAVWTYTRHASASPAAEVGHRVLPHLDPSISVWMIRDEAGRALETSLRFMGPTRTIRFFHPEPGLHIAAVRIKVEWVRPLLGLDAREWTDVVAPLPPSHRIVRLRARTAGPDEGSGDLAHLCRIVADLSRSAASDRSARLAHAGLEHLRSRFRATLGIESVAADLGVSPRHLRRSVREVSGASPKTFHRIRRLERAAMLADRQNDPAWSALSTRTGYYDQPHMIREYRVLAQASPSELWAERRTQGAATYTET